MSYLQVSLEEYLIDGDTPFFLKGNPECYRSTRWDLTKLPSALASPRKELSEFLCNEDPRWHLGTLNTILKGTRVAAFN